MNLDSVGLSKFEKILLSDGIAQSRTEDIEKAFSELHKALSRMDYSNRRVFFSKDVKERLKEFAKCHDMSDVTDVGIAKKTFCYHAPKDDKEIRIEVVTMDDPNRKVLAQEHKEGDNSKVGAIKTFPTWDEACIYAMRKNLENGLLADDVSEILASSNGAKCKETVEHALDALTKDLINEKAVRGFEVSDVANMPVIKLSDKAKSILSDPDVRMSVKAGKDLGTVSNVAVVVVIQKDQDGEYRVPGPAGKEEAGACYTNDRDDAIGTAKHIYGKDAVIKFRNVEVHMSVEDGKPAVDVPVSTRAKKRSR